MQKKDDLLEQFLMDQYLKSELHENHAESHPIQIFVDTEHALPNIISTSVPDVAPPFYNEYDSLMVPGYQRNRSGSIASSTFETMTEYSDFDSTYGEVQPFNGATVVRVPSPYIRNIHSPTPSMMSMNMNYVDNQPLDSSTINQMNFTDYYRQHMIDQELLSPAISPSYIPQSMENTLEELLNSASTPSNQNNLNDFPFMPPASFDPNFMLPDAQLDDPFKNAQIPDGKFWKTIKYNGNTLYQCPWDGCGKTFTRPYNLKSHYLGHTGEKPFKCQDLNCQAAFSRKHDLKRHEKLHSGEKLFSCPACGKSFSRNDALGRHLRANEVGKESACALRLKLKEAEEKRHPVTTVE